MFCKFVTLNLFSRDVPFEILVLSCNGLIIKKTINSNFSNFCLRVRDDRIKLIARHNGISVCKTIYLSKCRCQKVFVEFSLNKSVLQGFNIITLFDVNYGMPVKTAILNFETGTLR